MQSSIYVALSGQIALEKRLDSIANNIANLGTVGFRADGIKFETLSSQTASDSVAASGGFCTSHIVVKRLRKSASFCGSLKSSKSSRLEIIAACLSIS